MVFIHGLSGSSSAWLPYEKIFEDRYNILIFDIREHGKSKKSPSYSDYEIKKFADDLNDLALYLKIPKFVLISHSFATLIALEYLKYYEKNVFANILFSPIIDWNKSFLAKILRPLLALSKIFSLLSSNLKPGYHLDYTMYPNTTDWSIKRIYPDVRNTTLRVYLYCLRQALALKNEYPLEEIKVPTLIVHGIKDTMIRAKNSIILSKKIPNSELVLIPNTNHFFVLNDIKKTSGIIEASLEKIKI